MKQELMSILTVISDHIGDTDPDIPEDFTEDDIRLQFPLVWACRRLSELIRRLTTQDGEDKS